MQPQDILDFWFKELSAKDRFAKSDRLDSEIRKRFLEILESAAKGKLSQWRATPGGRLAEIIVLDQFSRNVFRDQPRAFAQDALALSLAEEMVRLGHDREIEIARRSFVYMPYMHSESKATHEKALKLFSQPGLEFNLKYEILHKDIVDRFGRFPHRNIVLGRESTAEEIEFLKSAGSSF